jgi:hypothetical protein
MIPVRVRADAKPVLASERRMAAHRGHPIDPVPCPVCGIPLGERVTVLILAGISTGGPERGGVDDRGRGGRSCRVRGSARGRTGTGDG